MRELVRLQVGAAVLRVGVVDSPEEQEACERLRFRSYALDLHQVAERDFPDGRETDRYDPHSVHLIGVLSQPGSADEVVGTVRGIDTRFGCLVEGAQFSGTTFRWPPSLDRARTIEVSRLIGHTKRLSSGGAIRVWQVMFHALLRWCRENDQSTWIFAGISGAVDQLVSWEWPVEILIPGKHVYHDSVVQLGRLPVPPTEEAMYRIEHTVSRV